MDDVASVRDMKESFPEVQSTITYVEDPIYFPFAKDVKAFSGDTLVIEVSSLLKCDSRQHTWPTILD